MIFSDIEKKLAVNYYASAIDTIEMLVRISKAKTVNSESLVKMMRANLKMILSDLHSMEAVIAIPLNLKDE